MRIFKPAFLLMALFVGASFAADGVVVSRAVPSNLTSSRSSGGDENVARNTANTTSRATVNRTTVSRATLNTKTDGRSDDVSRVTSGRSVVSRGADSSSRSTTNANRTTVSRATTTNASRNTTSRAATTAPKTATVTRAATTGAKSSSAASRRNATASRAGTSSRAASITVGTRGQSVSVANTNVSNISGRMSSATIGSQSQIAETREQLERSAELHTSCQVRYNECMDQFCAVLDESQGRCSCSANLSRYSKSEKAVTEANEKLLEVAQAIRYVGLSADEIRAILSETEAEEVMRDTKDTSATHNMLLQIEEMIKDPTARTNNYVSEMEFGLDMDLSFSSDPLDIFNLDFLHLGTNSSSISNMRGAELYKTAKKRCATILNQCKDAGATQDQIVGNYDMAIDRDCIAYEADLNQRNETLLSNVRSANLILQKARLAVMQNKNQYDALGCVAALENCMKDDMVCGDDYLQCVDPTKTYVDADGAIIMGQDITVIQSFMSEYNNAVLDQTFLQSAYNTKIDPKTCTGDGKCVVKYLLKKIGTQQKTTDEGLCRAVLDKCQLYTYDSNRKYKPYNDIVVNYLQRAMANIKSAQQRIISEYASNCVTDVSACYTQQISQIGSLSSYTNKSDVYSIMRGACRSVALTCGLVIFTGKPAIDPNQELTVGTQTYNVSDCKYITDSSIAYGSSAYNNAIINCISDMFYDSLLNDTGTDSYDYGEIDSDGCRTGYLMTDNKCTAITYSITYELGGGNFGASHPESVSYDQLFEVSAPSLDGFVFAGWNIDGMDTTMHKIGGAASYDRSVSGTTASKFKNLLSTAGAVTFTAHWRDISDLVNAVYDASCTGLIPKVNGGCIANGYRCETGYESTVSGTCEYISINTGGNGGSNGDNSGGSSGDNTGENSGGDTGGGGEVITCNSGTEISDSNCIGLNSPSGCVRKGCKCMTGYHLENNNCAVDLTPQISNYTLSYSCGEYGGTPPDPKTNIAVGDKFSVAGLGGCTQPSGYTDGVFLGWQFEDDTNTFYHRPEYREFTWEWTRNRTMVPKYSIIQDASCTTHDNIGTNGGCVKSGYRCIPGFTVYQTRWDEANSPDKFYCAASCTGNAASRTENSGRMYTDVCTNAINANNMADGCSALFCNCVGKDVLVTFDETTGGGTCRKRSGTCPINSGTDWRCTGFGIQKGIEPSSGFGGCVAVNCGCNNGFLPKMVGNEARCIDPCESISNSQPSSECVIGTEPGCAAQGCKCDSGMRLNDDKNACVLACDQYTMTYTTDCTRFDASNGCAKALCKCNDGLSATEDGNCVSSTTHTVTYACGDGSSGTPDQTSQTVQYGVNWSLPTSYAGCSREAGKRFDGWSCQVSGTNSKMDFWLDPDNNMFYCTNNRNDGCVQGVETYLTKYLWNNDIECSATFYEGGWSCSSVSSHVSATQEECPTHASDYSGMLGGCIKGGCRCPDDMYYSPSSKKCILPSCDDGSEISKDCFDENDINCLNQYCKCTGDLVPNSDGTACVAN